MHKDIRKRRAYFRQKYREDIEFHHARFKRRTKKYRRKQHLQYDYGLSWDRYEQMLKAQKSHCAICGDLMEEVHVDHDHACCSGRKSCGKCIRGLLCAKCNVGIGLFNDDPSLLKAAIKYLGG